MGRNGNQTVTMRELALEAMISIVEKGENATAVMQETLEKYQYLPREDRAFFKRLTQGTLEHLLELDYLINQVSKTKVKKMKPVIRNILRLGAYQLKYMDSVPDRAACNEAVNLAVKKNFHGLRGYVNGVMRSLSRGFADGSLSLPSRDSDFREWLSIGYSMPLWLCELFEKQYGADTTEKMFQSFGKETFTTLHLVHGKTTAGAYRRLLCKERETNPYLAALQVEEAAYFKEQAVRVKGYDLIEDLPGYEEGVFFVQDESSMLSVAAAYIKPGQTVVDVCASPGGKSLLACEYTGSNGLVYSFDVSARKVERLNENKERMNYSMMIPQVRNARMPVPYEEQASADVVLADVPCSGLGVIGKKADIRYKLKPEGLRSLIDLQREILTNAMTYVKPGGTLLFSTCTVNKEENEGNVDWILKQGGFVLNPESLRYLKGLGVARLPWQEEQIKKGYLTLIPGINHCDGFFLASFRKE